MVLMSLPLKFLLSVKISTEILQNTNLVHTSAASAAVAAATAGMVVSWSCELCGRLFATRDEWSAHAKSHLPDTKLLQDKMQQATQHQVCLLQIQLDG